jgi:TrmH family RNA methyltransferase
MLSKNEIKDIQSLSHKKYRDELNLFIAEGPKIVSELIQLLPEQIEKIYACKRWLEENEKLIKNIQFQEVDEPQLNKLSQLQTPNQVVGIFKQLQPVKPDGSSFVLYLDTIQDPGNFGTIMRIADWFGIKDIVCSRGCTDRYNPKVVQSTMASIARVNVYYDETETWLNDREVPVLAATLLGSSVYDHVKLDRGVLVIGNESKGIRKEILRMATEEVTIPKKGEAESLNAAVATGILLSYLLK